MYWLQENAKQIGYFELKARLELMRSEPDRKKYLSFLDEKDLLIDETLIKLNKLVDEE